MLKITGQKTVFSKSAMATAILFILGDGIIYLPTHSGGNYTLWGFSIALAAGLILYFAVSPIYSFVMGEVADNGLKRLFKGILLITLAVAPLFFAAQVFSVFVSFVSEVILPQTPIWLINIVFLLVVVFFALKRQEDSLKFSLICSVFVIIGIIFFSLASISDYELKNITIFPLPEFRELIKETKPYFINPLLPSLLLPFYYRLVFRKNRVSGSLGAILGYLFLGICLLSVVLLFGTELASKLSNPYASAISTISIGRLYTRLDGFSYFIYFATAITKINVCIFCSYSCLKKLNKCIG